jgi:hypothetical protein
MPFIYLPGERSWAETWRKDQKRQPTNGQKSFSPLNGHKIVEVTVLPIQRFALRKNYVFVDVIKYIYKGNRMAPTNAEFLKGIIYEGFLVIALEAVTFKKVEWNSSLK